MQIYLARPGGQKQGPFTLEQVQQDLADRKYRDTDFWAFHDGLPNWIPLYTLPGLYSPAGANRPGAQTANAPKNQTPQPATPEPIAAAADTNSESSIKSEPQARTIPQPVSSAPQPASEPAIENAARPLNSAPASSSNPEPELQPEPEVEQKLELDHDQESDAQTSGDSESSFPYAALEQIFVFTSGEPRPVFQSQLFVRTMEELTGESLKTVQHEVATHVIGRVDIGILTLRDNAIPAKAWRAIAAIEPDIAGEAREGGLLFSFRAIQLENQDVVAILCFYNKNKLVLTPA